MRKIHLDKVDIDIYYEKLENGLEVILIPDNSKKKYYMTYVTKYGSIDTSFTPYNEKKEIKTPDGIAHFLEHKMFEQVDGIDPFQFFAESGSVGNASTSFTSTQYLCYGTKECERNLEFLLSYVHDLYLTDENVEKEKGIIVEELKMYEDIPEYALQFAVIKNLYHTHPNRVDIGGTIESVTSTTKEQLETCYHTFYQPNNMFLIVAGNYDEEKVKDIVDRKLRSKKNASKKIKRKEYNEPKTVFKEKEIIKRDIAIDKAAIAFKFEDLSLGKFKKEELDIYLSMISSLVFGEASSFREKAREKNLLNSFSYEWETIEDYHSLILYLESKDIDAFIEMVLEEVDNIKITSKDIDRIKKVWIANSVKSTDHIRNIANVIYSDMIRYEKINEEPIKQIESVNKSKIDKLLNQMEFKYKTIVKLLPNEK